MRLTELDPHWVQPPTWVSESVFHTGITFRCPHCEGRDLPDHGPMRGRRLAVMFTNPIDPDGWVGRTGWGSPGLTWHRDGNSFETLTLEPSCDFSASGHWHGRITNGEVT